MLPERESFGQPEISLRFNIDNHLLNPASITQDISFVAGELRTRDLDFWRQNIRPRATEASFDPLGLFLNNSTYANDKDWENHQLALCLARDQGTHIISTDNVHANSLPENWATERAIAAYHAGDKAKVAILLGSLGLLATAVVVNELHQKNTGAFSRREFLKYLGISGLAAGATAAGIKLSKPLFPPEMKSAVATSLNELGSTFAKIIDENYEQYYKVIYVRNLSMTLGTL